MFTFRFEPGSVTGVSDIVGKFDLVPTNIPGNCCCDEIGTS